MPQANSLKTAAKRVFDIAGASTLLVALGPALAFGALLVKSQRIGPVLFKQTRYGLNGQPFTMYKLRSMREPEAGEEYSPETVSKRMTNVTRWLRRSCMDELPQLFNILRGDMSLVGPRPDIRLHENVPGIYTVRPGLTGLTQISGRSQLKVQETDRLDCYYANTWTIAGDCLIIAKTVPAWLFGKGYVEADDPAYISRTRINTPKSP